MPPSANLCKTCDRFLDGRVHIPPPIFPALCDSNQPPNPSESENMRTEIHGYLSLISHLDQEVSRVKTLLVDLQASRRALQSHVTQCKAILSPVRRLPAEIVGLLLSYAVDFEPWTSFAYQGAALRLGQICRSWRDVINTTSRIWSLINLELNERRCVDMLTCWLNRSGQCMLMVSLAAYDHKRQDDLNPQPVLDLLSTHAHRLSELRIKIAETYSPALTSLNGKMINLHTLHFENNYHSSIGAIANVFASAPALRNIYVAPYVDLPGASQLPWHQLESFSGEDNPVGRNGTMGIPEVLRRSPNMLYVRVEIPHRIHYGNTGLVPHILHQKLQSLELVWRAYRDNSGFLTSLTLPALQALSCSATGPWPVDQLKLLLVRSSCQLTRLSLDVMIRDDMVQFKFIECLEQMASLLELEFLNDAGYLADEMWHLTSPSVIVRHKSSAELLLQRLTVPAHSTSNALAFLPKLQRLKLCMGLYFDFPRFTRMVVSRWHVPDGEGLDGHPTRIQYVQIVDPHILEDRTSRGDLSKIDYPGWRSAVGILDLLRKQGLSISVERSRQIPLRLGYFAGRADLWDDWGE